MKEINKLIEEATMNVKEDRAATKVLLTNLMKYMSETDDRHREVGLIAAKYVETLQRSNEQLVKIASLVHKKESNTADTSISESEREDLFDMISDHSEDE
tara:strand:- start:728 stop:1027 length:300 start_codon:yes stop_codon:yes gene_type:complete